MTITVADLKHILDTLPDDAVISQVLDWHDAPKPVEHIKDLGWQFNNFDGHKWAKSLECLIVPIPTFGYYPTFRPVLECNWVMSPQDGKCPECEAIIKGQKS